MILVFTVSKRQDTTIIEPISTKPGTKFCKIMISTWWKIPRPPFSPYFTLTKQISVLFYSPILAQNQKGSSYKILLWNWISNHQRICYMFDLRQVRIELGPGAVSECTSNAAALLILISFIIGGKVEEMSSLNVLTLVTKTGDFQARRSLRGGIIAIPILLKSVTVSASPWCHYINIISIIMMSDSIINSVTMSALPAESHCYNVSIAKM